MNNLSEHQQLSNNRPLPKIDHYQFRELRPACIKEYDDTDVKSIDFSECGNFALCSSKDFIKVYKIDELDPLEITVKTTKQQNFYGIAKFHKNFKLIHSTFDNKIMRLDFEQNSYGTIYPSSSAEITSIAIMKDSDQIFATSASNCAKVWDLRSKNGCVWKLANNNNPVIACHPFKREIAIAYADRGQYYIEKHDIRSKSSPKKFEIENSLGYIWTDLSWSDDGKMLMSSTKNSVVNVIEAESGKILNELKGFDNLYNDTISACFTPCCKYAMSGSQNGRVHFWSLRTGSQSCVLFSQKLGPIHKVAFNPQAMCIATAGEGKFAVWVENKKVQIKTERNK